MKLKMSEKSLFAVLLRSPWWISMTVAVIFGLACKALLPEPYVPFGVMGAFPFMVIGLIAAWRQWQAPNPEKVAKALEQVAGLSWAEFSVAVEAGYRCQDFVVEKPKSPAVDFLLTRAGRTTAVQCKRWKAASQGIENLRELAAARETLGADHATVIALAGLSDSAKQFAKAQHIHVMTAPELARLMAG